MLGKPPFTPDSFLALQWDSVGDLTVRLLGTQHRKFREIESTVVLRDWITLANANSDKASR